MKKRSKRRSVSSSDTLPEASPLFIDRCAWSHRLGEALQVAGIPFIAHQHRFRHDTPDEEWLTEAGRSGWIVITRDKNIRRKPNEIAAMNAFRVIAFILAAGDASAADTATLIIQLHRRIIALASAARPPAVFTVTLRGQIARLDRRGRTG